jgi:Fe2+ or Zn2+ uptake regulation protein
MQPPSHDDALRWVDSPVESSASLTPSAPGAADESETCCGEDLQHLFSRYGLRCTRQRRALYEALTATDSHPTADDLFHQVSRLQNDISLATVYNTLEAFCRCGLAQKLPGKGGSARYDATTHNHLHLRDTQTGQVADAPHNISQRLLAHLPKEVIEQIQRDLGFRVDQVQIELIGRFC